MFTLNSTVNATTDFLSKKSESLTQVQIVGLLLLILLVITIISGNVLVIVAFFSHGRKMKTVTNYFIVSLAVSDILVGTFSVPFWIWVKISLDRHVLASTSRYIFTALDIMCGGASIYNLSVISLERLYAVVYPASHRNLLRKKNIMLFVILSVWVIAVVNSALYFVKEYYGWIHYNIYVFVVNFLIPAFIIVTSYIVIFHVAQGHATEQQRIEQEMRLATMIGIVIALFVACWLPFFLLNLLYVYCHMPACDLVVMTKSIPYVKFLHYSNSMMNPLIYAFRNSDYREAFKKSFIHLIRRFHYKRSFQREQCHTLMNTCVKLRQDRKPYLETKI